MFKGKVYLKSFVSFSFQEENENHCFCGNRRSPPDKEKKTKAKLLRQLKENKTTQSLYAHLDTYTS